MVRFCTRPRWKGRNPRTKVRGEVGGSGWGGDCGTAAARPSLSSPFERQTAAPPQGGGGGGGDSGGGGGSPTRAGGLPEGGGSASMLRCARARGRLGWAREGREPAPRGPAAQRAAPPGGHVLAPLLREGGHARAGVQGGVQRVQRARACAAAKGTARSPEVRANQVQRGGAGTGDPQAAGGGHAAVGGQQCAPGHAAGGRRGPRLPDSCAICKAEAASSRESRQPSPPPPPPPPPPRRGASSASRVLGEHLGSPLSSSLRG